jgi:hypothetical protein
VYQLPDVFSPSCELIVSQGIRDALLATELPNLVFDEVVFEKVFEYPYQNGPYPSEVEAYDFDEAEQFVLDRPNDEDLRQSMPPYYEWLPASYYEIAERYEPTFVMEDYRVKPRYSVHAVDLKVSPDMFRDYPFIFGKDFLFMQKCLYDIIAPALHPDLYLHDELEVPEGPGVTHYAPPPRPSVGVEEEQDVTLITNEELAALLMDDSPQEDDVTIPEDFDEATWSVVQRLSAEVHAWLDVQVAPDESDVREFIDGLAAKEPDNPVVQRATGWLQEQYERVTSDEEDRVVRILHDVRPLPDALGETGVMFPPEGVSKKDYYNSRMAAAVAELVRKRGGDPDNWEDRLTDIDEVEKKAQKIVWKQLKRQWQHMAKSGSHYTAGRFPTFRNCFER